MARLWPDALARVARQKSVNSLKKGVNNGAGGIRTHDLPLRRRPLYPAELQPQGGAKRQKDEGRRMKRRLSLGDISLLGCPAVFFSYCIYG